MPALSTALTTKLTTYRGNRRMPSSMSASSNHPPTYAGSLQALLARLPSVVVDLHEIRSFVFDAEMAAPPAMKADLRRIGDELETINGFVQEKLKEALQRLAQDEAGSLG